MVQEHRVFILGAGFSMPAGMPLATELLPLLADKLKHLKEMRKWLNGLAERLAWLKGSGDHANPLNLNIEQVFHHAHFDIEVYRLKQHDCPVGRHHGPGTAWNLAESVSTWLSYLERALSDVIFEKQEQADLTSITRWAKTIHANDSVVTFNYDTLAERVLHEVGRTWNHGTGRQDDAGIPVFKMHGSIDWIVAHRSECLSNCDSLFEKENANRGENNTGHVEDDYRLWRCRTPEQLQERISGGDLQVVPEGALPKTVGIAGLGSYKQLHQIPGLGRVWANGMSSLYWADRAIVVGFSMSDFDAMAQMQFVEVARARRNADRPLKVTVVDPAKGETMKEMKKRFEGVFGKEAVNFVNKSHDKVDWAEY
jgi:hypothetical protein